MAIKTPTPANVDELLDVNDVIARSGHSSATISRYVKRGALPAIKTVRDGRRRYLFSPADVDAAFGVQPVAPNAEQASEDSLRSWAQRVAASAPPMRVDQRDIVAAAFTTALRSKGV